MQAEVGMPIEFLETRPKKGFFPECPSRLLSMKPNVPVYIRPMSGGGRTTQEMDHLWVLRTKDAQEVMQ